MMLNLFFLHRCIYQPSISKDTSPISLIHSFAAGIPSIISRINSLMEIKQIGTPN